MHTFFFVAAIFLGLLIILSLYRAVIGPTVLDRLIGVNAIGSKTTALLILIGLLYHRVEMFVDISLAYAMLNFVAVLAASRYFQKRKGLFDEIERSRKEGDLG
jgi:multicomponent Na+:H+ antiporter subunit F